MAYARRRDERGSRGYRGEGARYRWDNIPPDGWHRATIAAVAAAKWPDHGEDDWTITYHVDVHDGSRCAVDDTIDVSDPDPWRFERVCDAVSESLAGTDVQPGDLEGGRVELCTRAKKGRRKTFVNVRGVRPAGALWAGSKGDGSETPVSDAAEDADWDVPF